MQSDEYELRIVPIDQVIGPRFVQRPVDKNSSEYLELSESIRIDGQETPVSICPAGLRGEGKFEIVVGNWRYNAHLDLGLLQIDAKVYLRRLTDLEVLKKQIGENAIRKESTLDEYRVQIKQIEEMVPGITQPQMAVLLKKTPQWVSRQMKLLELDPAILRMVDRGEIPLGSAYMLAKIRPSARTPGVIEQARMLPVADFKRFAADHIRRFMEQVQQGRQDYHFSDRPFTPTSHQRLMKDVEAALSRPEVFAEQITIAGAKTPIEIANAIARWTIHLDPVSVEKERRKHENTERENFKKLYLEREPDEVIDD